MAARKRKKANEGSASPRRNRVQGAAPARNAAPPDIPQDGAHDPEEAPRGIGLFEKLGPRGWVCALAILVTLYGLAWGMPRLWDTAADSVVPEGILAASSRDFTRLTSARYPPLHFYVLRMVFVVADGAVRADRSLDLGVFENPKLLSAAYTMSARVVSAAMGVATVMLVFALTRGLHGRRAAVFASVVFLLSPVTQYYSKNANLDIPYAFWLAVALWFLYAFFEEGCGRALVWAALAATAAVCTKDQAYGFLALFPIPILWTLRERRGSWGRALGSKHVWTGLGLGVLAFALIHQIPFAPERFAEHVRVIAGPASEGWRETSRGAAGQARLLAETVLRTAEALTTPVLILALAGVGMAWKGKGRWMLWGPVGYWLTFLAVVGYVYPRFVLPIALALSPFAGLALARLSGWKRGRAPVGAVLVGLALAWPAARCGALLIDMEFDSRQAAQHWIEANVEVGGRFGYLGPERDMPRMNREELNARRLEIIGGRFIDAQKRDDFAKSGGNPSDSSALDEFAFDPDVLVVSIQKRPGATLGFAEWTLRSMGGWGRIKPAHEAATPQVVRDSMGLAARFEPLIGWLAPDVSPSVGRTLEVWVRVE